MLPSFSVPSAKPKCAGEPKSYEVMSQGNAASGSRRDPDGLPVGGAPSARMILQHGPPSAIAMGRAEAVPLRKVASYEMIPAPERATQGLMATGCGCARESSCRCSSNIPTGSYLKAGLGARVRGGGWGGALSKSVDGWNGSISPFLPGSLPEHQESFAPGIPTGDSSGDVPAGTCPQQSTINALERIITLMSARTGALRERAAACGMGHFDRSAANDLCIELTEIYRRIVSRPGWTDAEAGPIDAALRACSMGIVPPDFAAALCLSYSNQASEAERAILVLQRALAAAQEECNNYFSGPASPPSPSPSPGPGAPPGCRPEQFFPCTGARNASGCFSCCTSRFRGSGQRGCEKSCQTACKCWISQWPDGSRNPYINPMTGRCYDFAT